MDEKMGEDIIKQRVICHGFILTNVIRHYNPSPESLDPWSVVISLKTENYPAELATETIDMDYQNICCIVERGNASYCWRKS